MVRMKVTIYTDGGCDPNPGLGGWGALILIDGERRELSGSEIRSTNNRMELTAAIEALRSLEGPAVVDLFTDSQYLQRGIEEWMPKWLAKNWRGSNGPVANQDLWQDLLAAERPHQVSWHWVRGHSGNVNNERVDALVHSARGRKKSSL
ncbi:MAG: ribonuclease HI [Chloroflexi bacterium]|nr:ribonuclease HI [Chloroflexota bacterium]